MEVPVLPPAACLFAELQAARPVSTTSHNRKRWVALIASPCSLTCLGWRPRQSSYARGRRVLVVLMLVMTVFFSPAIAVSAIRKLDALNSL